MSEIRLSILQKIFYGWGKLASHRYNEGSFPKRFSKCVGFITPKLRAMDFDVEVQTTLLSSFLQGVTDEFFKILDESEDNA